MTKSLRGQIEDLLGASVSDDQVEQLRELLQAASQPAQLDPLEKVREELIAELRDRGVVHVLEWIGTWYDRAAGAWVRTEVRRYLGPYANDAEALEEHLAERLAQECSSLTSRSSGQGANLMRDARIAALSGALRTSPALGVRRRRGEAIYERLGARSA